jgi:hypothetical protein
MDSTGGNPVGNVKLGRRFTVDEMKFPATAEAAIAAAASREVKSMEDIYSELFGAGEKELPSESAPMPVKSYANTTLFDQAVFDALAASGVVLSL